MSKAVRQRWIVLRFLRWSPTVIGPFPSYDAARDFGNEILAGEYDWEIADPYTPQRWNKEKSK